jgi:hypothetical protein
MKWWAMDADAKINEGSAVAPKTPRRGKLAQETTALPSAATTAPKPRPSSI